MAVNKENEAQTGNENFAGSEAAPETNGINPTDISQSEAGKIISDKTSLQEVSMTELYDRVYVPKAPVVEGLLYPGTYIFAGSPKVGKSFFMAQLAYHVAAGIPLWDYPVRQGAVLYLALEDYRIRHDGQRPRGAAGAVHRPASGYGSDHHRYPAEDPGDRRRAVQLCEGL